MRRQLSLASIAALLSAFLELCGAPGTDGAPSATRPCTDKDWRYSFSECDDQLSGARTRGAFAYAPPWVCDVSHASSRPLPTPLFGVPCSLPCEADSFLGLGPAAVANDADASGPAALEVGCRACPAGRFSLGGGFLIDGAAGSWAHAWPAELRSFCFYKGDDLEWLAGSGPQLLCALHLLADGEELVAETRPGIWNDDLPDAEFSLPLALAPGDGLGCEPLDASHDVAGKAVLVRRGTCFFTAKASNLAAGGAAAVVLYNDQAHAGYFYPAAPDGEESPPIPIFMITLEDGEVWREAAARGRSGGGSPPVVHVSSSRCSASALETVPRSSALGAQQPGNASSSVRGTWDSIAGSRGCSAWAADPTGRFVHSGSNLNFHWLYSVLELSVRFVREGHVRFRFAVDAEVDFDGVLFIMDEHQYVPQISVQAPYADFLMDVPRGLHAFQWIYVKDYGVSGGEDRARLQMLEVVGTEHADLTCTSCHMASGRCDACAPGEYLEASGEAVCRACPEGRWSLSGTIRQSDCMQKPACTAWDYHTSFTILGTGQPCKAQVVARWVDPITCDPARPESVPLPASYEADCPACQPHERRDVESLVCVPILRGCPVGTRGRRALVISQWHEWPASFSTDLLSHSATDLRSDPFKRGWQLAPDGSAVVVGSAVGGGEAAELEATAPAAVRAEVAKLHLDALLSSPGELRFSFESSPAGVWQHAAALNVNGSQPEGSVVEVPLGGRGPIWMRVPLPAGEHRITWSWHYDTDRAQTTGDSAQASGVFRLLNISLDHAQGAGVIACESCPPGSAVIAGGTSCHVCAAGRATFDGPAGGCLLCPAGRAAAAGSSECGECGTGLESTRGSAGCHASRLVELATDNETDPMQWDTPSVAEAWLNATGGRAAGGLSDEPMPVQVEGHYFYFGLFAAGPQPGFASGQTAYWWERLPAQTSAVMGAGADQCGADSAGEIIREAGSEIEKLEPVASDDATGLRVTYLSSCELGGYTRLRRTRIFFRCDMELPERASSPFDEQGFWHVPDLSFAEGYVPATPQSCMDMELQWPTPAACPLCREGDWVPIPQTACLWEGRRGWSYIVLNPCRGGAPQPKGYEEQCPSGNHAIIIGISTCVMTVLCCIGCYVALLRRRYSKYMQLEDVVDAPTRMGAGAA